MTRSKARAARVVGSVVMLAAVIPALAAGSALAADAPEAPVAEATATTAYADEVAIGTAVKIAAPGVVKAAAPKAVDSDPSSEATPSDAEVIETDSRQNSTAEATPSDAEVIETDSRQNATEVAVLGTRIGSNELASTGPSQVTVQALWALALIGAGLALRFGPSMVAATGNRRH